MISVYFYIHLAMLYLGDSEIKEAMLEQNQNKITPKASDNIL